jgi:Integrase core domain
MDPRWAEMTEPWALFFLVQTGASREVASYRYVILDRDAKFDGVVVSFLRGAGLTPKRTSVQSPWQNGITERWVGSCRREQLDHVILLNQQHLRRLVRDYRAYYQGHFADQVSMIPITEKS